MIYFSSDFHYGHTNLCRGTSSWEDKSACRDFTTIEEMNKALVDGVNKTVGENDTLYFMGDWSFGGIGNIWNFRKQLKVKDIHFIIGNHDHFIEKNRVLPNIISSTPYGSDFIDGNPDDYGGLENGDGEYPNYVEAQRLFSSVQHYKEIRINGQFIVLSHYAMRVWNHSHKGAWMLYGHSHSTLDELSPKFTEPTWIGDSYYIKNSKTMDVGVDVAYKLFGEYRPFSITEIKEIMDKRDILFNDHHNSNTN